ncbi:MAG: hypothetical protein ACI82F_003156 [Planctomycetota bacterium]|jgi:hypothetical protein
MNCIRLVLVISSFLLVLPGCSEDTATPASTPEAAAEPAQEAPTTGVRVAGMLVDLGESSSTERVDPKDESEWETSGYWERATADWPQYSHDSGFSMMLPSGWRVEDSGPNLELLNADTGLDGVRFFVVHLPIQGIDYVDDDEDFQKVMDWFVAQLPELEFKQRNKEMLRAPLGYQDLSIGSFVGESDGKRLHADVYLTEAGRDMEAFMLFAITSKADVLRDRVRFLGRAFTSSFDHTGADSEAAPNANTPKADTPAASTPSANVLQAAPVAGDLDAACVGRWISSSVYVSNGFSFSSDSYLYLGPDGVCLAGSSSGGGGGGVVYTSGGVDYTSRGTWSTEGGVMDMRWESGNKPSHQYQMLDVWEPQDTLIWSTPSRVKWKRN